MANIVKIKNSGTINSTPPSLEHGELAINYRDGILFFKDSSSAIIAFNITDAILNSSALNDLKVSVAMQIF